MTLVGFSLFQGFSFNESLATFKKGATEHKVLDRLSILDAGYQWESIIAITLSYNSLKYKPRVISAKIKVDTHPWKTGKSLNTHRTYVNIKIMFLMECFCMPLNTAVKMPSKAFFMTFINAWDCCWQTAEVPPRHTSMLTLDTQECTSSTGKRSGLFELSTVLYSRKRLDQGLISMFAEALLSL